MTIVETSWQEFLSLDSEIPHNVHFLAKGEDEGQDSASKPIGAHKVLLAGVSPVFRRMLFGPLKEEREGIEVRDTTHEAFNTMVKFIYKPPGSRFFPAPYEDDENHEGEYNEEEFNQNVIHCPQKFFDLVDLAEKYEIFSLKEALTSNVLKTLPITDENVIFAAKVATKNKISTKMLARCLKFLLQKTKSKAGGDLLTQFWALVNNNPKEPLKERLAGTPFANIHNHLNYEFIKDDLDEVGHTSFDNCLHLACSGVHVR